MNQTASDTIPPGLKARLEAAEKAVTYALRRIGGEPAIYWHCGEGTQLFALLIASRALTSGKSEEHLKEAISPDRAKFAAFEKERRRRGAVMEHLDDQLNFEKGGDAADGEDLLTIPVRKLRSSRDEE